ncbi:MAG: thiamine biosynthesis protein [Myxococcaceae bacterium]|nr:thiamine biosynthesis protein [Myxococcaceae bacterium]
MTDSDVTATKARALDAATKVDKKPVRAIGLLSGGLDSMLAHAVIRAQGIEVRAVNFYTGLCIVETQRRLGRRRRDGSIPANEALGAAANLEMEMEFIDISGPDYLHLITHPRYGYGANANPCVDCRIFMFKKAKALMEAWGASFVFTGEVLGQRPKSQRRDTLRIVERDSGLTGRLVRPLSAKLLEPTIPELEGLLDRERLFDFRGRSRASQMALAKELGLTDYPQPAGGCCYLTDESFGRRFHDLMARRPERNLAEEEVLLLAMGRHFRLGEVKLIVARNETESVAFRRFIGGRHAVEAIGVNGPLALVEGAPDEEARRWISAIVARYGQGRVQARVRVEWRDVTGAVELREVAPHDDEAVLASLRI